MMKKIMLENLGKKLESWAWLLSPLIPVLRSQGWQVGFCEFKGSQGLHGAFKVYIVNYRTTRAMQRDPVSSKQTPATNPERQRTQSSGRMPAYHV